VQSRIAFITAVKVEFSAEMVSMLPEQVTVGGLGGISAGVLDALAAGTALVPWGLCAVVFEGGCPHTPRADTSKMAPTSIAASLSQRVMNDSIVLLNPHNGRIE
jgi:hypothetical protein